MKDLIKKVAQKLDDQLNFNDIIGGVVGHAVEFFDGKILEAGLAFGVSKVPEEYKPDLEVVFNAYISGDLSQLPSSISERLNQLIDIPGLDEEDEGVVLGAIAQAIFKILSKKINA